MDRGYADFNVTSTQVAIAPEKDDIFITINVDEGEVYKISDVKITGEMVVPKEQLEALLLVKPGQIYSRKDITATTDAMKLRLGLDGYAFATIDAVPQSDATKKEIALTFVVDPKNRVYVRRVNFNGTSGVNDEVFRREMRQFEGAYLSNNLVDRSKERIQRLPFIEKVDVETNQVPNANDLVDVDYKIKEGLPGQFGGGIGYSESQSLILSGNFVHSNFMGTGQRVAAEINTGRYSKQFSFSHTDPYTTTDGVQRTVGIGYRSYKNYTSASSAFDTTTISASLNYDFPITEFQYLGMGLSAQRAELSTYPGSTAPEGIAWTVNNGEVTPHCYAPNILGVCSDTSYSSKFSTYEFLLGWRTDSRNRALFADRGTRARFNVSYTLPGSEVEYWTANFDFLKFVPVWRDFTLMFNMELGYGKPLGDTTAIPPYRNFFGGGPDSVRGYRESRLGPKDSFGRPYGGNIKTVAQTELLLPIPDKWRNSARFSLFYDIGNIFSDENIPFRDRDGVTPVDYSFSYHNLKRSAGVAVQWLAPLGIFRFSYAVPLNNKKQTTTVYGDETEGFQFSIGQAF
jgi:outer membrane protein insertion porin family